MSWIELFETLDNGLSISNNAARSFMLEVARVLDPALKINMETICLSKLFFKFVYESCLLLNLC